MAIDRLPVPMNASLGSRSKWTKTYWLRIAARISLKTDLRSKLHGEQKKGKTAKRKWLFVRIAAFDLQSNSEYLNSP